MKRGSLSTRERILDAARHLFQQRGYHAVGTAEILEEARAPKGSMYHHFPGGKEQMAIEAVIAIRDDVLRMMRELESEERSVAHTLRTLAKGMAGWLKASHWQEGTMLASTTVGSVPTLPKMHAAIRDAMAQWRGFFVQSLIRERWPRASARRMSQTILASIEGAMIVARVDQDERVVLDVAETLATVIERGAGIARQARR